MYIWDTSGICYSLLQFTKSRHLSGLLFYRHYRRALFTYASGVAEIRLVCQIYPHRCICKSHNARQSCDVTDRACVIHAAGTLATAHQFYDKFFASRCFILHILRYVVRGKIFLALRLNFNCINYYENSVMYWKNVNVMLNALARKDTRNEIIELWKPWRNNNLEIY